MKIKNVLQLKYTQKEGAKDRSAYEREKSCLVFGPDLGPMWNGSARHRRLSRRRLKKALVKALQRAWN
jgi:hypothetical protein